MAFLITSRCADELSGTTLMVDVVTAFRPPQPTVKLMLPLGTPNKPDPRALSEAFDHGRFREAAALAQALIVLHPGDAYGWRALGAARLKFDEALLALAALDRALSVDRNDQSAWGIRGVALQIMGHGAAALQSYSRAIALDLQDPGVYHNQGLTLTALKKRTDSLRSYSRAVIIEPTYLAAWVNQGHACRDIGLNAASANAYFHALCLNPAVIESLGSHGLALRDKGDFASALRFFDWVLRLQPDSVETLNNRGAALRDLGRYHEALESYSAAVAMQPAFGEALTNVGTALMELRRVREAIIFFERASAVDPKNSSASWNGSLGCLSIGQFEQGWLLHEQRFAAGAVLDPTTTGVPVFVAGAVQKPRVLIRAEQGIGDELMFGSMITDFVGLTKRVLVHVDPRLLSLFRRSLPAEVMLAATPFEISGTDFDAQIPLGSLGRYVRKTLDDFSGRNIGYLRADPCRVTQLRGVLSRDRIRPTLGISWRTSNRESSARRSIDLGRLCETVLRVIPDICFVNLQYGDTDDEVLAVLQRTGINIWRAPQIDLTRDLDDVAALIVSCDAVLTIGNTTAHLCGALGKPATVLLPFAPSWRWMAEGHQTPWYASLELFRKDDPSTEWEEVILAALVGLSARLRAGASDI